MCVSYKTTKLLCMVKVMYEVNRRGARRMREGDIGMSSFNASAQRRGAGHVQPEVQPVVQATNPIAPVTLADLAAMEQRFKDLIMQMRAPQQPAPPAPTQAPVEPQSVPDQLLAEA
ncbi:gag protease polyprotein [Cucumis melo var. makuwa]|uniref:Gag protease polyprotein n=1 Tax=Cucumis melo var. makuwa TaxID=1194695 RepID=A0A5A7UT19_CUCMM|nr:gag protease polyprotein [Cucumis melo var. makuwa]